MNSKDLKLLNQLVGKIDQETANQMEKNLACFLHAKIAMFIPTSDQCPYAVRPNHTHPSYTFTYCFQPYLEIVMEGKDVCLPIAEGKCLSPISPDVVHQEREVESFQSYIAIAIDKVFFENILKKYTDEIPVYKAELYTPEKGLLELLRCFMMEYSRASDSVLLDAYVEIIGHALARSLLHIESADVPLYERLEIDGAIGYMTRHMGEKITVEVLASTVNLSAGYFSKIFHEVTGKSPIDFLNQLRLKTARTKLLVSHKSITEIALECGFTSSSYFTTCFTEVYHVTPSVFRREMQTTQSENFNNIQ